MSQSESKGASQSRGASQSGSALRSEEALPLVSVAIPLYQSGQFFDCIVGNIERCDYPHLEILLSDRHGLDDTLELLRARFGDDPRLRFLAARDELDWVGHYNALLQAAKGQYFCWMPHDDVYPPSYIRELVAHLEAEPNTLLAYGRLEVIGLEGEPLSRSVFLPPPIAPEERWTSLVALRLLVHWNLGIAFRGVFRRESVVRQRLFLRPTLDNRFADAYWMFALALRGRLTFVPSCCCQKRYYAGSTHARWIVTPRHARNALRVLRAYCRVVPRSKIQTLYGAVVIRLWLWQRVLERSETPRSRPSTGRRIVHRVLRRALRWGIATVVRTPPS